VSNKRTPSAMRILECRRLRCVWNVLNKGEHGYGNKYNYGAKTCWEMTPLKSYYDILRIILG
jgi:hypothetical protein